MDRIPVTNKTTSPKTVAGVPIAAGCTRMIDKSVVPGATDETTSVTIGESGMKPQVAPPTAQNVEDEALVAILERNVDDVLAKVEEMPVIILKRLLEIEVAREKEGFMGLRGGPRKGVISHLNTLIELREEDESTETGAAESSLTNED